jgi:hypothetical protein
VILHAKRSPFYVSDARPADIEASIRALAEADESAQAVGQLLGASELVLVKGDANYRRLVGDRRRPASTAMESLTAYFPAPFGVLDLDLDPVQVQRLQREDPEWRTNGRRGLVRLVSCVEQVRGWRRGRRPAPRRWRPSAARDSLEA